MDYCSFSPDRLLGVKCCKKHDEDYDNQMPKFKSDWALAKCVSRNASVLIGAITLLLTST